MVISDLEQIIPDYIVDDIRRHRVMGVIFIFKSSVGLYNSVQIIRNELNSIDYGGENSEEEEDGDKVGPVFVDDNNIELLEDV